MPVNPLSYNAILISEQALKEASVINDNVDMKILTPTIKMVQDIHMTRLLGTGLLVYLQNCIAGVSGFTLNPNDLFLLDNYIQPTMIWAIQREAPVYMTYKYMNKGIEKQSSDNGQPAGLNEIQMLTDKAGFNFDLYAQRMINYLAVNQQLYPAYLRVTAGDDIAPTARGFRSRIYLGNGYDDLNNCSPWFRYR